MSKHWFYFRYLVRHKYFVFIAGRKTEHGTKRTAKKFNSKIARANLLKPYYMPMLD